MDQPKQKLHWKSALSHPADAHLPAFRSLSVPIYRGSTVLFETQESVREDWDQSEYGYTYGLYGTPTALELAARIRDLEGARHTFVVPGGQAAITSIYLAFCKAGSHALLPTNAYAPNRELGDGLLHRLGITLETYDPLIGEGIEALIRPNTTLVWCESPGSVTMEVQDVPAIVQAAHRRGVTVALDNTYSAGVLLDAFALGVDVSMQALTKYIGGHSDLLLGTVSVSTQEAYEAVGLTLKQLGMAVSPDDCSLALRGLLTLGVRLEKLEKSALEIARWLAEQPVVERVLHPALPSCEGHEFWKRDFSGSASVFSIVFERGIDVNRFANALRLFKIGFSWGGVTSLALTYPTLDRPGKDYAGRLVRLNVGLEEPADLIADLANALRTVPHKARE